jgi:tRNA (guanine-N7-)-methyltransferase
MRLRNVKGASEKIKNSKYIILNPEKYKGNYKNIFNNNNPICIEIGTGKGKFIRDMALNNPSINFIGIEKFDSVIVRALEKIEELDIPNLRMIRMDATEIENVFEKEIDTIYLNFSDPWPKKRHAFRRLTSKTFLERYNNLFSGKKHIIFKTDNRHLFEFSIKELTDYGYTIDNICLDLYNEDTNDNISTEYEDKFHDKGMPIYKIEVYK